MSLKEIAVQGMTLSSTFGTASVTNSGSVKTKATGKSVFREKVSFSVSGATSGTCVGVPITGDILATATKTKADNKFVNRKDDEKIVSISGTDSGSGASCSFSTTVKIANAGQSKAKGE